MERQEVLEMSLLLTLKIQDSKKKKQKNVIFKIFNNYRAQTLTSENK